MLVLAARYGGGPGYWLDPDLDETLVATAVALLEDRNR